MRVNPGEAEPLLARSQSVDVSDISKLQRDVQQFLQANWKTLLSNAEQLEIAKLLGLGLAECSELIHAGDFDNLFRNTSGLKRFMPSISMACKLLISLTAAGGGFKTGLSLESVFGELCIEQPDAVTTAFNAGGGVALGTFFAIGDYGATSRFFQKHWQDSKSRLAAYVVLLLLNAIISAFFAYTGAKGTMAVFGFALKSLFEEEMVGSGLMFCNLVANMGLCGNAAETNRNRTYTASMYTKMFFVYICSMLMYIVAPFQVNLFGLEEKPWAVKGVAVAGTSISIFYSAAVMLSCLEDPKAAYKAQVKSILHYISECQSPARKGLAATYFLIMSSYIFIAMLALFWSNNVSAFMWLVKDIKSYLEPVAGNGGIPAIESCGHDFSLHHMNKEMIALIIYAVSNFLLTAVVVGIITLEGVRELLTGFEPYGAKDRILARIEKMRRERVTSSSEA